MQAARGTSLNPSDPTDEPAVASARTRSLVVFASIAALGYAVDVVSKVLAVARLTDQPPVPVVGDLLQLYLARNPGAAFSTGTSYTLVLTFVAIAAAVAVLVASRRLASVGWAIGLGFLMAGILGNLTDRVFRAPGPLRGHVVDSPAAAYGPGARNTRSVRLPRMPAIRNPSPIAQPTLASRREATSTATAAAIATNVSTSVYDVPVLNAAPGLRAR